MLTKLTVRVPAGVAVAVEEYAAALGVSASAAAAKLIEDALSSDGRERRKTNAIFATMLIVEALAEKSGINVDAAYGEAKALVAEELYGEEDHDRQG